MALAALTITLSTLHDLLLEEAKILYGVSDDVRHIRGQLEMMKSFLKDADTRQHDEERVRTWVQQVRRLAYRTEDVLETYAVQVAFKRRKRDIIKRFASIFSEGTTLHKVGEEIADIKSEITTLKSNRETYGIKNFKGEKSSREARGKQRYLRQTYSHEYDEHFVGMDDDIRELVSLITNDEGDPHRVVSIWGMGGLGKTTLARKIFNHSVVKQSFQAFAWVCITQDCQIDKVFQDILKQVIVHDIDGDQTTFVPTLYQVLEEKKCLIVLDDIWKIDDWEILRPAFPIAKTGSKVLLTTRTRELASIGFLYELKSLNNTTGWELLWRKTRAKQNVKDLQKENAFELVGKEIIRKCGYLPLAISLLGGILREKLSVKEWEKVNEDIDLYLKKGEASKSVPNVLGWSYDDLPYYLKPCFLYMARYRKDEMIDLEQLYRLWIAEGLVLSEHCGEAETMVDVAKRYLSMLASRCIVKVEMDDMSIVPRLKSCQVHDLMRDLCLTKGKEEEFFKIIFLHNFEKKTSMDISSLFDIGRRLCITKHPQFGRATFTEPVKLFEHLENKHLRSLIFGHLAVLKHVKLDMSNLKKFKLLRVLVLEACKLELLEEICQLIHLRYLSLRGSSVKELPSNISTLPYLQTLDLRSTFSTQLPNIFWKMRRLKHIYLPSDIGESLENLQFKDLSELETLHGVQIIGNQLDLSGLVNLRSFSAKILNIFSNGLCEDYASSQIDQICSWRKTDWIKLELYLGRYPMTIEEATLLRKLLLCENLNDLEIVGHLGKFPPYEPEFWPNLTRLWLYDTRMEEDPMQYLKKLPNIRSLELSVEAFVGKEMVCDAMAFPELRHLKLYQLSNLEIWRVHEGAMPKLSHLEISECRRLETIMDGLNFAALKEFDIQHMSSDFVDKYGKINKH